MDQEAIMGLLKEKAETITSCQFIFKPPQTWTSRQLEMKYKKGAGI